MSPPLSGIRVVDLTDARGELAGRMLADLGAEVVKIDPPSGILSRTLPPFDEKGNSLYQACYGAGKTRCDLDLEDEGDRLRFLAFVEGADVLIESFDPGKTIALGIDEATLRARNRGLIYMSITPYGQFGPKAHWPASNLTLEASGGRLSIQGDPDRPPLPVGFPQASLHAGAQAAADIVVALNERATSRSGQFLDLSTQEAIWWTLMAAQGAPVCLGDNPPGVGDERGSSPPPQGPRTVPARDGLVTIAPGASRPGEKTMYTFAMEEARERGELPRELERYDWNNWVALYRQNRIPAKHMLEATEILNAYVARRTKLELIDWALANNLRLGPLNSTRDLVSFPQYRQRGFFAEIGGIEQPATWVQMSRTPLVKPKPADRDTRTPDWTPHADVDEPAAERTGNAFEGLKVADFSWVAAGPTVGKMLADHGATVIKVESSTRPDLSRTLAPHINGKPGLNRSYWSFLYATSKLSLQCNLGTEAGRGLARRVCDWADVVIESFSPGTMKRMGLDYETLSVDHPELIMFSTSMLGQTGELSGYAGFGQQASGFAGFHYITGWPDRVPCGVATPYTDVIAPKFGIASLAAAILERRKSGRGQYIDLAQAECSMMFLAPLILDEIVNGQTAERAGFDSPYACPQGVYATAGIERYITIAIETKTQWRALCELIPRFPFREPGFDAFEARWSARDQINATIARWTRNYEPFELEKKLIDQGIPASVVQRPLDVYNDAQIEARNIKQRLPHTECGEVTHYGFCTRFSAKPQMVRSAPPCLGEQNDYILHDLLALTDTEIQALHRAGAIE